MMDIIAAAFGLADAVDRFKERVRKFYYQVMLSGQACPKCGGKLAMIEEGLCRCRNCGQQLDPTVTFQRCRECSGQPLLRIRRYQCRNCGRDIVSRFLFDGLVFDTAYFRQKMVETRQRKAEQRERVRQMLAESRSDVLDPGMADLAAVPGLEDALNGLTADIIPFFAIIPKNGFDLKRYQSHIEAHIGPISVCFGDIPPLSENLRIDRVWRFITTIFLAHAGILDIRQDGQTIWVKRHETDTERCGVSRKAAAIA